MYYFLFFMLFLFYLSITEKSRQAIGTILLDYNKIILKKGNEELEINLSDGWKVELSYSGYRSKRMPGDFIPRYNSYSGMDNYLRLEKENQRIEHRILVSNENQENLLLELVSFWETKKYKIVFNRNFRAVSSS